MLIANADQPTLEFLVRNIDVDTVRAKRQMRQLLDANQAGFLREATRVLAAYPESRGACQLLGLVAECGLLIPILCAPGIGIEQALQLAQMAKRVAASTDIQIARGLADMLEKPDTTETLNHITRLMDILAEISDAARVFPSVVRLLRHPNPHIRSKAVLMIGRQSRSAQWVRHRLADSDPRIRANALEALWDVDTAEARELLEDLMHDPNNRVAGNAILGLYRLGEAHVIPEVLRFAAHASPLFRSTAAWVMGETGDPRFTEPLAALLRETNGVVRKRAFSALGKLRIAAARAANAPACLLSPRLLDAPEGHRRVLVAVAGVNGWVAPDLLPNHFLLSEDARPVYSYRVVQRPLPETAFVVFLLPVSGQVRMWREVALACLPWKRPSDLWACDFYEGAVANEGGAQSDVVRFQTSVDSIRAEFAHEPLRYECPDLWRALRRLADLENEPVGKRHVIVFREERLSAGPPEDLVATLAAAQATVHVISTGPDPILEEFCRKTSGAFTIAETDAREAAIQAYIQQLSQYEISWPAVNLAAWELKMRLHGAASGEAAVPLR